MADKRLYIPVTFKKDEEWLYNYLMAKSGKSAYIKDVLKMYIKQEDTDYLVVQPIASNNSIERKPKVIEESLEIGELQQGFKDEPNITAEEIDGMLGSF